VVLVGVVTVLQVPHHQLMDTLDLPILVAVVVEVLTMQKVVEQGVLV
jgi:hypothetical protein